MMVLFGFFVAVVVVVVVVLVVVVVWGVAIVLCLLFQLNGISILSRMYNESVHSGSYVFIRLRLLRWIPLAHCAGVCATAVSPPELAHCHSTSHSPYSRQVTEQMACSVVIHPPPSVYPKVGNGVLGDQRAIKHYCQNDKPTIIFTARDLVHWNDVASENIPRVCKSWESPLIHILFYIFVHSTEVNFR